MEKFLAEDKVPKSVVAPSSVATAKTGERVGVENVKRVAFIVDLGAGTSTDTHTFVLKQHDAPSAGNTHDLKVANPYFHKIGAAKAFSKVEVPAEAATYDLHGLLANSAGMVVFEILSENLRADCKWVSLNMAAANGTQLGSVLALADHSYKPAYTQEV